MRKHGYHIIAALLIVIVCTGVSMLLASKLNKPKAKLFNVKARQYAYDPPVIEVNQGDTVHVHLVSLDVVHGFYLEGHGINAEIYPTKSLIQLRDPSQKNGFREVEEIVFVANKVGKFRYRCSHTCGYLHPFMQGELIVGPNYPFRASIGAAIGIFFAGFLLFFLKVRKPSEHNTNQSDIEKQLAEPEDHQ